MKKLIILSFILFSTGAYAVEKNSVLDTRGNPVRDGREKCVRHDWNSGVDPCAPPAPPPAPVVEAPPPPPAPSPARALVEDDRIIYFEFDKADITAEAQGKIENMASALKSSADVQSATIVGYADKMGSTEYNDALSQKRALAVQDYLNQRGYVNTSVAQTSWLGESRPTASCDAIKKRAERIACLAPDRKVEVKIQFLQ